MARLRVRAMNQPPDRPSDPLPNHRTDATEPDPTVPAGEWLEDGQAESESDRLRSEAQRLKVAKRRAGFDRIVDSMRLLVGLLEVLLGLRFFLRLTGANPENLFAKTIYNVSNPFAAPFVNLFGPADNAEAVLGKHIFDLNLLVAMVVYAILGAVGVRIVRYVQKQVLGEPGF